MRQLLKILTVFTFLLLTFSCKEEVVPTQMAPDFVIEEFAVPLRLNVAKPRDYTIAFRVTHPEGAAAITDVTVTFLGSDQATQLLQLPLYDDGGVQSQQPYFPEISLSDWPSPRSVEAQTHT